MQIYDVSKVVKRKGEGEQSSKGGDSSDDPIYKHKIEMILKKVIQLLVKELAIKMLYN